ncbi:MAG: hypothetical protein VB858_13850, partial [Planctomycetaceae bacterium]
RVLRLTVRNINDVDNATSAGGPTPELKPDFEEFVHLCNLFRVLQKNGQQIEITYTEAPSAQSVKITDSIPDNQIDLEGIVLAAEKGYRLKRSADGATHSLWTSPPLEKSLILRIAPTAAVSPQMEQIRGILELAPLSDQTPAYSIQSDTFGQLKRPGASRTVNSVSRLDRTDLMFSTRSMKEMMFYLSHGISVPQSHLEQHRVRQTFDSHGCVFNWGDMTGDLFRVNVQRLRPRNAAVAVRHAGYWFYIDEADLDSKSTFNLLLELFNLQIRAGGNTQIPILTI